MSNLCTDDFDLAAALFYTLGGTIPHNQLLEDEAQKLSSAISDRKKCLLKVIELCNTPTTPKQLYLVTKAYSWLGAKYHKETLHFAKLYLDSDGWSELPHRTIRENGITINLASSNRASIFINLAQAQEGEGNYEAALANYAEAYRLEPYNAMNAIKAADVIFKSRSKQEALNYLHNQEFSKYYAPIKYVDFQGNQCRNDIFQQLIKVHILKLETKTECL